MVFSSLAFLCLFLPAVWWLYYLLPGTFKNLVLLLASIAFYALGEPRYVFLFLAVIFWTWVFGLAIMQTVHKDRAVSILILGLTGILGVLCMFKYSSFVVKTINAAAGTSYIIPKLVLPVGISFYTFQAISYMVDVYRGEPAQKNLIRLGLYLSFFPQLIAGPIVRYKTIAPQIAERRLTEKDLSKGMNRLIGGLCKKVLLANTFGQMADHVFLAAERTQPGTSLLWMGALAYTLQIYFDFSGYSDMAIGLGHLFGFRLPENFNYPYAAANVTDFWHRWHITLSQWFRDYVYIPLGGSHRGKKRQGVNLLLVWILTGIWHGAGWTFILWGILWGLALILEKLVIQPEKRSRKFQGIYRMGFLVYMVILWVIFRSPNLHSALWYIRGLFLLHEGSASYEVGIWVHDLWLYIVVGGSIAAGLPTRMWKKLESKKGSFCVWLSGLSFAGGIVLTVLALSVLAGSSYNPFLYFNF